jgi:type II secretory pathway pseudopilin PulG
MMAHFRHAKPKMTTFGIPRSLRRSVEGFTLAETMVGILIFMIVIGGLLSVFTMSMLAWKEGSRDVTLQSSGRLIIEKIIRGPGSRFGLREATEGEVTIDPDGKGIAFSVDKNNPPTYSRNDDTETRIYLQNNEIIYDPSTSIEGNEMPVVSFGRVEDLRFELNGKTVNIDLWMTETSQTTHSSHVRFRGTAFLRKSEDPDTET